MDEEGGSDQPTYERIVSVFLTKLLELYSHMGIHIAIQLHELKNFVRSNKNVTYVFICRSAFFRKDNLFSNNA